MGFEDTQPGISSVASAGSTPIAVIDYGFTNKDAFIGAERNYFGLEQALNDLHNFYNFKR